MVRRASGICGRGVVGAAVALCTIAAMPSISQQTRAVLDRVLGVKGIYVEEESAHKFSFPRTDINVRVGRQRLSPAQAPHSWATFSPSMQREAMVVGELILVEGEVNAVLSAALDAGLEVTGLGATLSFEQPRLLALNLTGQGKFQELAASLRRTLDQIGQVRRPTSTNARTGDVLAPIANNIDPVPLNGVLSMRGVAVDGVYRAAIGRVGMMNGTAVGREMGMRTTIVIFGSNDRASVDAELILSPDELQRVLKALRTKGFTITSIRNHAVGVHPEVVFVGVCKEGSALDLAKGLRFALDVQVGAGRIAAN